MLFLSFFRLDVSPRPPPCAVHLALRCLIALQLQRPRSSSSARMASRSHTAHSLRQPDSPQQLAIAVGKSTDSESRVRRVGSCSAFHKLCFAIIG